VDPSVCLDAAKNKSPALAGLRNLFLGPSARNLDIVSLVQPLLQVSHLLVMRASNLFDQLDIKYRMQSYTFQIYEYLRSQLIIYWCYFFCLFTTCAQRPSSDKIQLHHLHILRKPSILLVHRMRCFTICLLLSTLQYIHWQNKLLF
jgi:hypothetical protein